MNWTPMMLDPSTKVVQNQILNKIKSTFFSNGAWLRSAFIDAIFDLSGTHSVAVGYQSSNWSSKIEAIEKTIWPPEPQNHSAETVLVMNMKFTGHV